MTEETLTIAPAKPRFWSRSRRRGLRQPRGQVRRRRTCLADRLRFGGDLSRAGLRQNEHDRLLILSQNHFPASNRSQPPTLIILAQFQPKRSLGRLLQKDSEPLITAYDGADQGERRTLRLLRFWRDDRPRSRSRRDGGRRRPPRGRKDWPIAGIRQRTERDRR